MIAYLVNLEFHPDHCGVCVSPSNWTTFRSIEEVSVLEELELALSSTNGRSRACAGPWTGSMRSS